MSLVGLKLEYSVGSRTGETVLRDLALGFEQAGNEMRRVGEHVFPRLIPVFEAGMERQFDAQGAGVTGRWSPLTDAYARWKAQHFPGKPILERTGALREALTRSSSPRAYREYSARELVFGSAGVEYASFFQFGTRKMVARAPFDFDAKFEADLKAAALDGIRDAIRATRLGDLGIDLEGEA